MLLDERLAIACLSYHRALAAARQRSSPATWRGLLTASRNLASARRDRKNASGRTSERAAPEVRLAPVVSLQVRLRHEDGRELWAQVNREWERSQALIARASEIMQQARRALIESTAGSLP